MTNLTRANVPEFEGLMGLVWKMHDSTDGLYSESYRRNPDPNLPGPRGPDQSYLEDGTKDNCADAPPERLTGL